MVDHWEPVLGPLETFMTRFETPATLGQSKIINCSDKKQIFKLV